MRRPAFLLAAFVALLPGAALAQSYQCSIPGREVRAPARLPKPDGPRRVLPVGGYLLALSWSPEFCRGRLTSKGAPGQCNRQSGEFGFILHGLWPQGNGDGYPQYCGTSRPLDSQTVRRNFCRMPSVSLMARQWVKHGSCTGWDAERYFKVSGILFDSIQYPDMERLSRDPALNAGQLRREFLASNSGWRADAIAIHANQRGWLREIRLCYDRRFRPAPCAPSARGLPDKARIKIWRGL